jgi:general secretion pathway protein K
MSMPPQKEEGRDGPRAGFILAATLWILIALATLTLIASLYVAQSAVSLRANDDEVQVEALITASLELAAYQLSAPSNRPTHGAFRFRLARANVAVEFLSESARIDLNAAPKALVAGLFAALGAQAQAAEEYANRVVGWRTSANPNALDGEAALYQAAGLLYSPRRSPFNHADELWLVLGLPPALVERAMPFVTVYSGLREVNVLDAAPEVIAALPGMSSARINVFLGDRERLPRDSQLVASALGDAQTFATIKGSDAYRVRTRMVFDDGRQRLSEVVITMMNASLGEPYRVLLWRSDLAAGPTQAGVR